MYLGTLCLPIDGDITIGWTDEQESLILPRIKEMLDAGYTFFLQEYDIEVTYEQIKKIKRIRVSDATITKMVQEGKVSLLKIPDEQQVALGDKVDQPEVIARSNTVATRPYKGG